MTMFWIRHGETALNAARVLQPPATPLSPRGLAQARAVAERLAPLRPVAVLTSDLPRALQTAEAIAAAAGGVPLRVSPWLHERNFGDLRGRPYDELGYDPIAAAEAPPGGESMAEFVDRVARAFAQAVALRASLPGPLAVVSHGLVIRALLDGCVALPAGTAAPARIGNTAVTEVDAAPPHAVRLVNCTAHLAGRIAEDGSSLSGG